MRKLKEIELAGLFLITGAVIIMVTIWLEYRIGWIGVDRPGNEIPEFMFENWDDLRGIWRWQLIGHFSFFLAVMLMLKNATPYMRVVWSILVLCELLVLIAFGITLGSYGPALEVYDTKPELFTVLRGGILSIYSFGRFGLLLYALIFIKESLDNTGPVDKRTGIVLIALVAICIIMGQFSSKMTIVTGASIFLLPLALGYFYWRNKPGNADIPAAFE